MQYVFLDLLEKSLVCCLRMYRKIIHMEIESLNCTFYPFETRFDQQRNSIRALGQFCLTVVPSDSVCNYCICTVTKIYLSIYLDFPYVVDVQSIFLLSQEY